MADFLLLLYSTPSFDRGLKEEVHLDWSVGARKDQHEIFEGISNLRTNLVKNNLILSSVVFCLI